MPSHIDDFGFLEPGAVRMKDRLSDPGTGTLCRTAELRKQSGSRTLQTSTSIYLSSEILCLR